jgi:chemotaxis protein histidine kinase CheA
MSQNLSDYFALEAGEYLEQLDALLGQTGTPEFDRLFRLARGVRGSARVADEAEIAEIAERMEGAARALQEHRLAWSEELRARAIRTVDDLKVLVRAHGRWGAAETARAREALARWAEVGGERERAPDAADAGAQLLPFLRREVVGIVSELDRAVEELRRAPEEREPLRSLVHRMRPLRGTTGVQALGPTLEVLEGVEDQVQQVLHRPLSITEAHLRLFSEARDALQGALAALERGDPAAGEEAMERFREAQERLAEGEDGEEEEGVLPIAALFYDDAGPRVVSSPLAPAQGEEGASEQVERFLRLEAAGFLDRAEALIGGLPAGREKRFGRLAARLARLARAVGELAGTYGMAPVAEASERAAAALRASTSVAEARSALARLRAALPGGAVASTLATEAAPAPAEDGVLPVESLLYEPEDALREALSLRARLEDLLGAEVRRGTPVGDTLDEIFGLVELGLQESNAR